MFRKAKPSSNKWLTRRRALQAGGFTLAGLATGFIGLPALGLPLVEIRMRSIEGGAHVAFDPIGLLVQPGTIVRWVIETGVHTTTAYHPNNDLHSLRIPKQATPWDSGYLVNPGDSFTVELTVEGVYDYYCAPHELAGMVGRIIVGRPGGPGALPFDYFKADPTKAGWTPVPPAARMALPGLEEIMQKRRVRRPRSTLG